MNSATQRIKEIIKTKYLTDSCREISSTNDQISSNRLNHNTLAAPFPGLYWRSSLQHLASLISLLCDSVRRKNCDAGSLMPQISATSQSTGISGWGISRATPWSVEVGVWVGRILSAGIGTIVSGRHEGVTDWLACVPIRASARFTTGGTALRKPQTGLAVGLRTTVGKPCRTATLGTSTAAARR
jgi:hypothetical protein